MNLEDEITRSDTLYRSGTPLYLRNGQIEVDEPQLPPLTITPQPKPAEAGTAGTAITPMGDVAVSGNMPNAEKPMYKNVDWTDPAQARANGTAELREWTPQTAERISYWLADTLSGLGVDQHQARTISNRIMGTGGEIGVIDVPLIPGMAKGIEDGLHQIGGAIEGFDAGRNAYGDLAMGIGTVLLSSIGMGAVFNKGREVITQAGQKIMDNADTLGKGVAATTAVGATMYPEDAEGAPRLKAAKGLGDNVINAIPAAPVAQAIPPEAAPMFAKSAPFEADDSRISTRLPTGKKATEDPMVQDLKISLDAMRQDLNLYEKNVGLVRNYPNMPPNSNLMTVDEVAQNFKQHVVDNLLFLFDNVPEQIRGRSKLWYDGARNITDKWSAKYNLPDRSVAGVLAALSPQKDWFQNVSLAERVLDIYTTRQAHAWDDAMTAALEKAFPGDKYAALRGLVSGKTLGELQTPTEKAMWLRTYDEAFHDRGHRLVTPEGEFGDFVTKKDGTRAGTGWGSMNEIGKAISAIEANGDLNTITRLMGERHKVRSFYNNIVAPNSKAGDVTIDTHAVAAGLLRPLSGNSLEVSHNFANSVVGMPNAGGSAITGAQGLYGLYADAYREAALARGVLPREMQSITWEAVRGLFPDTFKNAKNNSVIDGIWSAYHDGKIDLATARQQIVDAAGGITPPAWVGRDPIAAEASGSSSYAGRVPEGGVLRGAPEGVDSGAGGRASEGASGLEPVREVSQPRKAGAASRTKSNRNE